MVNQFNGLPTHVLAVHAAVVLVPLAALLGILFAVPRTRAWSRLPLVLASGTAVVAVFVAKQTGQAFQKVLNLPSPTSELVQVHAQRAQVLLLAMLGYTLLAALAFVVSRTPTSSSLLVTAVSVLMVLAAAGVAYQTYRVGDVGARAVWNPTGQADYGSSSGQN